MAVLLSVQLWGISNSAIHLDSGVGHTLVDSLCGQQDITRDPRSTTQDGVALSHISQVRHEFPDGRIVDDQILNVDRGERKAGAIEERGGVSRVWA